MKTHSNVKACPKVGLGYDMTVVYNTTTIRRKSVVKLSSSLLLLFPFLTTYTVQYQAHSPSSQTVLSPSGVQQKTLQFLVCHNKQSEMAPTYLIHVG